MTEWMYSLPLWWAKVVAIILFGGIVIWVWLVPSHYIFSGAPDKKRWRDVRIWATVLMLIQIALYLKF